MARLRENRRSCDVHNRQARAGATQAQMALGICYFTGRGRPRQRLRAKFWFERAAEAGHAAAHIKLGLIHRDGRLVVRNDEVARRHFRQAARLGEKSGLVEEGLLWLRAAGRAARRTPPLAQARHACDLFEEAAKRGSGQGHRLLANCYRFGRGRTTDAARADALYDRAASLGDETVRLGLANRPVRQGNRVHLMVAREGCAWANRAAIRGDLVAHRANALCLQVREARRTANRWLQR